MGILLERKSLDPKDALVCRRVSHLWRDSVHEFCSQASSDKGDIYPFPCITLPLDSAGCSLLSQFLRHQNCRLVGNRLRIRVSQNVARIDRKTSLQAIEQVPYVFWQHVERLEFTLDGCEMLRNFFEAWLKDYNFPNVKDTLNSLQRLMLFWFGGDDDDDDIVLQL